MKANSMCQQVLCAVRVLVLLVFLCGCKTSAVRIGDIQFLSEDTLIGFYSKGASAEKIFYYDLPTQTIQNSPTSADIYGGRLRVAPDGRLVSVSTLVEQKADPHYQHYMIFAPGTPAEKLRSFATDFYEPSTIVGLFPGGRYLMSCPTGTSDEPEYEYRLLDFEGTVLARVLVHSSVIFSSSAYVHSVGGEEFLLVAQMVGAPDEFALQLFSYPELRELDRSRLMKGYPIDFIPASDGTLRFLSNGNKSLLDIQIEGVPDNPKLHFETLLHRLNCGEADKGGANNLVLSRCAPGALFASEVDVALAKGEAILGVTWECVPPTDTGRWRLSRNGTRLVSWDTEDCSFTVYEIDFPKSEAIWHVEDLCVKQ